MADRGRHRSLWDAAVRIGEPRRLAAVPVPAGGESILSWLHRAAASWGVGRWDAARALGLMAYGDRRVGYRSSETPHPSMYLPFICQLPVEVVERVRVATGRTAEELRAMTLARYAGVAVGLDQRVEGRLPVAVVRRWLRDEWAHPITANICPRCVASGLWMISWHLSWTFLCPVHRCYLVAYCPRCGSRFEVNRAGAFGFCAARGEGAEAYCRADLGGLAAADVRDVTLLELQERINLLAVEREDRQGAWQVFRDLRAMMMFALFVGLPEHLDGADDAVRRRFEVFCDEHDDRDTGGRKVGASDHRSLHDPLVMAAVLRIAARIVFSADPYATASSMGRLKRGPDWSPRARSFAAKLGSVPFSAARYSAGPRLLPIIRAVVGPAAYDRRELRRPQG